MPLYVVHIYICVKNYTNCTCKSGWELSLWLVARITPALQPHSPIFPNFSLVNLLTERKRLPTISSRYLWAIISTRYTFSIQKHHKCQTFSLPSTQTPQHSSLSAHWYLRLNTQHCSARVRYQSAVEPCIYLRHTESRSSPRDQNTFTSYLAQYGLCISSLVCLGVRYMQYWIVVYVW